MDEPFQVETDASGYGVGGVLAQERDKFWKPAAYFSKRLNKCERNYSTTEKELYAIVLSIEYFRQFLYGSHFEILTDHKPLQYLLTVKEPSAKLIRWQNRLNIYDFNIKYRKGITNANADGLSRLPTEPDEHENEIPEDTIVLCVESYNNEEPIIINVIVTETETLHQEQIKDINLEWLFNLKKEAFNKNQQKINLEPQNLLNKEQKSLYAQWSRIFIIDSKLYRAWTIQKNGSNTLIFQYIVPEQDRTKILQAAHDTPTSGHLGTEKTQNRIKQRYYWPGWEKQTRDYVLSCHICQRTKRSYNKKGAAIKPIISDYPFQIITADIAGPLPTSNLGNRYILIIVDHFTKWAQVHAIPNAIATTVAQFIIKTILTFGIPDQIITDRGTNFQSKVLKQIYKILDIYQTRTTAYHPQCYGNSEIFIRTLKQMIRAYVDENQKDWDEKLNHLLYAYNSAVHKTTGLNHLNS